MSERLLSSGTDSRAPSADRIMKLQSITPKHHDWIFTVLFILHIGFDIYLLVNGIHESQKPKENLGSDIAEKLKQNQEEFKKLFLVIVCIIVAAAIASSGFFSIMKNHALGLVKVCFFSTAVLLLALGIVMLKHSIVTSIILFVIVGLYILYYYCFRAKFKLAAVLLSASATIIKRFKGLTYTSFTTMFFQIAWFIFWGCTVTYVMMHNSSKYMAIYLIFSFYWMHNVLQNLTLCIVAGVVGTWFFLGSNNMPEKPTKKSAARALKYSFGSISFGALLIAILQTIITILKQMERNAAQKGNMAAVCILCFVRFCIKCFTDIARWFQRYVLVHVALYGTSFIQSAKKAVEMMFHSGFDAIINDQITAPTLFIMCFLISCFSACAGLVASYFIFDSHHSYFLTLLITATVAGFFIGYSIAATFAGLTDSCIVTLFVCAAEEPRTLESVHPEMWFALVDRYGDKITVS